MNQLGRFWVLAFALVGLVVVYLASPYVSELVVGHSLTDRSGADRSLPIPVLPISGLTSMGKLDSNWTVTTLEGQQMPIESFKGKALFINVWATWCGPCVMEMPSILRLYESAAKDDVQFVLLSLDNSETTRSFVASKRWQGPFFVAEPGLPAGLATPGIPATFLVNKRGEIVFREAGAAAWGSEEGKQLIRNLVEQ